MFSLKILWSFVILGINWWIFAHLYAAVYLLRVLRGTELGRLLHYALRFQCVFASCFLISYWNSFKSCLNVYSLKGHWFFFKLNHNPCELIVFVLLLSTREVVHPLDFKLRRRYWTTAHNYGETENCPKWYYIYNICLLRKSSVC